MSETQRRYFSIAVSPHPGSVAARYHRQYQDKFGSPWVHASGEKPENIHKALLALGPTPTREQVEKVIGNESWTRQFCDICLDYSDRLVNLRESEPFHACHDCLSEAAMACAPKAPATSAADHGRPESQPEPHTPSLEASDSKRTI